MPSLFEISGLALAIAAYAIVILTLTEPHDNIQILLFSVLLTAITFTHPLATPAAVVIRVRFINIS
ncbi:hypothetical protein MGWOODY_XGa2740 [hydrothermal vent metagenome]|uniref:Uncharacterized protein n=1 Tax=hydrothermal vent metagenome TaxID=652676 RepID=A0A160TTK3_9ZZZZ|nr:hypothetical protein [Gammaproteobacteria bacterium]PDH42530.1 MAG: hypothetical protein CNF00_02235 [Candidatus Thioglobus sp. MED-G25]